MVEAARLAKPRAKPTLSVKENAAICEKRPMDSGICGVGGRDMDCEPTSCIDCKGRHIVCVLGGVDLSKGYTPLE